MDAPSLSTEAARLTLLRGLDVLDTPAEAEFDALVASASRITGCPVALISLVDEDRLWFKARVGFDVDSTARHPSFCDHAIGGDGLFEVRDLKADARFQDNPLVAGEPHLRFYAGQPLHLRGHQIGTLCVIDRQPRQLSAEDRELLAQLSQAAVGLLLSRQRLREAEHERRRLLDFGRAGGDWMWESDDQHRYLWLSESFETMTGMSVASQVGRPISDGEVLDAESALPPGGLRYHELLDRRAPFARVVTAKPSPRGLLYLSRSAVPSFDAAGRFQGYRGTIRDVSTQWHAAHKVRERDDRLAKLASQIPGVIFQYQLHPDGRASYPYASDRTRELFETEPPRDGVGGDASVPRRLLHPDDREGFDHSIAESARTLQPWLREYRIVRSDGSVRWLDTFATPERQRDGSTLWHGFTTDITARKDTEAAMRRNEAQWDLAADAARIGLARLSLADGVVQLDARACRNHGFEHPAPHLTLSDWMNRIDPADRAEASAGVKRVLSEGARFEGRYQVLRPDGQPRWLEFAMHATRDAGGRIDGLAGICRDVHDQQTLAQIELARQEAERTSRAKSQFLSRLSHELRTPLNGILGFAQLMARDTEHALAPQQAQRLASMQRAGSHLLGLINDVLELSRSDAGEPAVTLQPVDLSNALCTTLALLHPLAQTRRIALRCPPHAAEGAPQGDAWVRGEARRIEQVLMNLLSNAIKFSPPDGVVEVQLVRRHDEVAVAISDRGLGLDAEQQSRLFQPFERLGAERLHIEGIGLGLFISRQLAEAMGGRITVASQRGAGSTFTLWLATAEAPPAEAPDTVPAAIEPAEPAEPERASERRCVVYVEDESLNQLLLQEMLRSRPAWQLVLAGDGATGLQLARERRPDLMLIDINLPDTTGLALVRRLRSDPATRRLRCIALSADAMREQIDAALAAGFDDYWTKPLDVGRALAALDALLGPAA